MNKKEKNLLKVKEAMKAAEILEEKGISAAYIVSAVEEVIKRK